MTDNILKKHVERTYPPPVRAPAGPATGGAKELVAEVYPADKTYRDLANLRSLIGEERIRNIAGRPRKPPEKEPDQLEFAFPDAA